jgi:NAD(P)-dependent dehydrogenase (short-subunit alcohol dehydrogenase family)
MTGPVALVTGGNRGIGLEVCRQLLDHGYRVVLGSRDLQVGRRAAGELDLLVCQLDVTDDASVAAAVDTVKDTYGGVDVLVNNAAIDYDTDARASSADLVRIERTLQTNLLGAWQVTLAFLAQLRASSRARIVNVSSESGSISEMTGGTPGYAVSKAALNALTRLLAGELRRDGILVNAVCPGWTDTDMGQGGRPVADGAASVLWAVLIEDDGPTGGFFRDGTPLPW